ncbi:MAG: M14 family metallopeptidase [Candidatus Paceibacterota bacterium]|jgi:hypothetical protein
MKKSLIALVIVIIVGLGIYLVSTNTSNKTGEVSNNETNTETLPASEHEGVKNAGPEESIGKSKEGRDIMAYHFGTGETELLFVGGIHGGYSWNTALVAFELVDYLKQNPEVVPANVKVTVIPVLNPDGLNKVAGTGGRFTPAQVSKDTAVVTSGRFNANNVDLNRNFDCDWKSSGVWQSKTVSGGTSVFSEPESAAIKSYVDKNEIAGVVAWYSSAGGVYASSCHNGVSAETTKLTTTFAKASGYPAFQEFNFYEITGDMVNWFAKNNVPAVSVLLTNHTDTEWAKNKAGIEAVIKSFAK